LKAAARRAQHEITRGNKPRDWREGRKYPFEKLSGAARIRAVRD
jgi:hypothetical protein